MPLLSLKDIGKIYVSEGNVSVGIRGVNLTFERGEFVAVTGKSGSGKSTLLNVISGMDTYEEGELHIEGEPTSHFLQPDWEAYREKYISFIFQDYNILESFTVLENVELALLHIEDKKERRARAMELIRRVGLASHARVKGSRLSGGQKQRTVIARALAKDSPIILADEPTGNLDAATSREIIALLREVSRDRLLIVVTHNFDEVAEHATRHVRVFDGAIESDHRLRERVAQTPATTATEKPRRRRDVRDGMTLGGVIFKAKPRLSLFLCLLMLIGTLGIFALTTLCGEAGELFEPSYMFHPAQGRVVLAKQSGDAFTEEELTALAQKHGAVGKLHFDALLDGIDYYWIEIRSGGDYHYTSLRPTYGKDYGEDIVGSYPTAEDEVLLSLPITYQPYFGEDKLLRRTITLGGVPLRISGVRYFYDNNLDAECLFTEEGFRVATAVYYLLRQSNYTLSLSLTPEGESTQNIRLHNVQLAFDLPKDTVFVYSNQYDTFLSLAERRGVSVATAVTFSAAYYKHSYYYDRWDSDVKAITYERTFTDAHMAERRPDLSGYDVKPTECFFIHTSLLVDMAETMLRDSYRQASLFFADDGVAYEAAEALQAEGYIAVPADTTYEPDGETVILNVLAALMMAFVWVLGILFLAFFINLCATRSLGAFRGEMAIMRSMGIPVKVIRVGMYVRMLLALIPAFVITAVAAVIVFTSPALNEYFVYLYAWQYVLMAVGMLLLTVRTTKKQIKKLFGESVKTALKGGSAE